MARVAIVYDLDFGERLADLAMRMPVWIIESDVNRAAAEAVWHRAADWPQISVTVFIAPADAGSPEAWRLMLEQIELRHRSNARPMPFTGVDVLGAPLTEGARSAMQQAGFDQITETARGFRASRALPC